MAARRLKIPHLCRERPFHSLMDLFILAIFHPTLSNALPSGASTSPADRLATSTTQTSDPFAISTMYTPPATCLQSHLTQMAARDFQIWLNYPVPVPSTTTTDCYPSQFISSFFSQQTITTPLPAISPLVCPVGYEVLQGANPTNSEYIACCPSGFSLALPSTSGPSNRPAYGATCYSRIQTVVLTLYDQTGLSGTNIVPLPSNAKAWALPMDGFADATATSGTLTGAASTMSTTIFAVPAGTESVSPSQIAGAVVGSVLGAILLLGGAVAYVMRRRREQKRRTELVEEKPSHRTESPPPVELPHKPELNGDSQELKADGRFPEELDGANPSELEAAHRPTRASR